MDIKVEKVAGKKTVIVTRTITEEISTTELEAKILDIDRQIMNLKNQRLQTNKQIDALESERQELEALLK